MRVYRLAMAAVSLSAAFMVAQAASLPTSTSAPAVTSAPSTLPAADKARIDRLIELLGSENYRERSEAQKALVKLGSQAMEQLRSATKDSDAERAKRASAAILEIENVVLKDKGFNGLTAADVGRVVRVATYWHVLQQDFATSDFWVMEKEGAVFTGYLKSLDTKELVLVAYKELLDQDHRKNSWYVQIGPAAIRSIEFMSSTAPATSQPSTSLVP